MKWVFGYYAGQAALISFVFLAVFGSLYLDVLRAKLAVGREDKEPGSAGHQSGNP